MRSIALFPSVQVCDKAITVSSRVDGHHPKKQFPQAFCIRTFRKTSTPSQSLALDVDQTPLDDNLRPGELESLDQVRITVYSSTLGLCGSLG